MFGYDNIFLLLLLKGVDINDYICSLLNFFYLVCEKGLSRILKFVFKEGIFKNLCKRDGKFFLYVVC